MKIKICAMLLLCACFLSCKEQTDEELFDKFVQRQSADEFLVLQTADTCPLESLDKDYQRIIEHHENDVFLFEKAKSEKETRWCIPLLACPLTEGDLAICMLIDMYKMSDDYFESVMYENIKRKANTAADFWDYLHESKENRSEIIQKIRDWKGLYTSSEILVPWTEEEVLNHSFELISETDIESFLFRKDSDGVLLASCNYGKKGKYEAGPIEYWRIEGCYLYVYPDATTSEASGIKIAKLKIDKENNILYGYRNNKKVMYKYWEN